MLTLRVPDAAADVPCAAVLPGAGVQAERQPAGRDTCPQLRVPVSVCVPQSTIPMIVRLMVSCGDSVDRIQHVLNCAILLDFPQVLFDSLVRVHLLLHCSAAWPRHQHLDWPRHGVAGTILPI